MLVFWLVHRIVHCVRISGKYVRVKKVLEKVRVKNSSTPSQAQKTTVRTKDVLFGDAKPGDV